MTYRTGNHWRVTIVDEGVEPEDASGHRPDARLRAIVMDGNVLTTDAELAELVCSLLNFRERAIEVWGPVDGDVLRQASTLDNARIIGEALAGRGEEAPGTPPSATQSAELASARDSGCTETPETRYASCGLPLTDCPGNHGDHDDYPPLQETYPGSGICE